MRALVLAALAACSGPTAARAPDVPPSNRAPDGGSPRAPVQCGDALTCSPDEYCDVQCTCCGMRIPEPDEASANYGCLPLPDSCRTADGPECQQRLVEHPCA